MNDGISDADIAGRFREVLRLGMTAFDCGAHIGEYTLMFAAAVGPEGLVHAFEPDPRVFPYLEENVSANALQHVVINRVALSDAAGTEVLVLDEDATKTSLGRFSADLVQTGAQVTVSTVTLDEYLEQAGVSRLDAIKIDVEGAGLAVLSGAKRLLSELRPKIIFVESEHHEDTPSIEMLLRQAGYEVMVYSDEWHPDYVFATRNSSA